MVSSMKMAVRRSNTHKHFCILSISQFKYYVDEPRSNERRRRRRNKKPSANRRQSRTVDDHWQILLRLWWLCYECLFKNAIHPKNHRIELICRQKPLVVILLDNNKRTFFKRDSIHMKIQVSKCHTEEENITHTHTHKQTRKKKYLVSNFIDFVMFVANIHCYNRKH